ncbi:hypothetical protein HDK64DRAFT_251516 [Phyllosticta capitalensis]
MTGQPDSAETAVPLAATPPDRPSAPVPALLRLPLELHHLIAARLSLPGYLALRLTHPYLYNALAAPSPTPSLKTLDSCARLAVRTYLAPYFAGCNGASRSTFSRVEQGEKAKIEPAAARRGKANSQGKDASKHCILCAAPYAPRLFKSTSSPAVDAADHGLPITTYPSLSLNPGASSPHLSLPLSTSSTPPANEQGRQVLSRSNPSWDVLPLPDGVCAWHVSRFARVVHEWPATLPHPAAALDCRAGADGLDMHRPEKNQRDASQQWCWYAFTSTLCPHCGAVGVFKACTCTRPTTSTFATSVSRAASPRAASDGCTHVSDRDAVAPQQRRRGGVAKSATTANTGLVGTPTDDDDNNTNSHCQTCALRPVTVFVRYLPNDKYTTQQKSWDVSSYRFWRDADDRLWVREEGFVSSPTENGRDLSSWEWGRSRVLDAWSWGWAMGWSGGRGPSASSRESERERKRARRRDGDMHVVDVPVKWIDV